MVSSWFRLSEKSGKNIKQHNRIMLMHELYEINLLLNNPELTQRDVYFMAKKKYNYSLACKKYYNLI